MRSLHDAFDEIVAEVPVYGDLDRAIEQAGRERRHRYGIAAGLAAAAAAAAVVLAVLAVTHDGRDSPQPIGPTPTPTEKQTAVGPVVRTGRSEVLAASQVGRYRLEAAGEIVPGRWQLEEGRRDVWVAEHFDEVGYFSTSLWWGKGTTTHEVLGEPVGVAISQDAHWIAWTRSTSESYQVDPNAPRVMEVVDTATGEVRWSRDADADAPEMGALAVTNDGVVVFGHCLEPAFDPTGYPRCDDARIDVWDPRSGVTRTVPTEMSQVQATGAHNGFLVSDAPPGRTPSVRPQYVHVSERGDVEVVATLPRSTAAVTADERFALLCAERHGVCDWSVLALDGGERRPIPSLAELVTIATDYDWQVNPYVVERDDLVVIRAERPYGRVPAVARCSLAQARCVRIPE
jgi:hypothetical protein